MTTNESTESTPIQAKKLRRRKVPALLIEATPERGGLGHWLLASPMILYIAWFWLDIFAYYSPIPWRWLDWVLGAVIYVLLFVLPSGYLAHWLVTSLPRLFQHAGWDVLPLEPVEPSEAYLVRYTYQGRERASLDRRRFLLRAAQGWVYLEIAILFAAAVAMIPLFFSAVEFGFGQ